MKFLILNKQALKVAPEHLMSSNRLARAHHDRAKADNTPKYPQLHLKYPLVSYDRRRRRDAKHAKDEDKHRRRVGF